MNEATISNWERQHSTLASLFGRAIICFLEYNPLPEAAEAASKLTQYRVCWQVETSITRSKSAGLLPAARSPPRSVPISRGGFSATVGQFISSRYARNVLLRAENVFKCLKIEETFRSARGTRIATNTAGLLREDSALHKATRLCGLASVVSLALLSAPLARANAILGLQNTNGSSYVDLTSILDGSYTIANISGGSPSAGSINVTNNVSGGITSLTLYYYGSTGPANDTGSTLDCQNFDFGRTGGGGQTTCSVYDPNNHTYYNNGASTPSNLPLNSYVFTWTFPSTQTADFNIEWSSFSGSGYTGCIAGTPKCTPVPEPGSVSLLATGLIVAGLGLLSKLISSTIVRSACPFFAKCFANSPVSSFRKI